jgi:hypothetical protein
VFCQVNRGALLHHVVDQLVHFSLNAGTHRINPAAYETHTERERVCVCVGGGGGVVVVGWVQVSTVQQSWQPQWQCEMVRQGVR